MYQSVHLGTGILFTRPPGSRVSRTVWIVVERLHPRREQMPSDDRYANILCILDALLIDAQTIPDSRYLVAIQVMLSRICSEFGIR